MISLPKRKTSVLLITAAIIASTPVLAERYVMRTLVDENIGVYVPPVISPWVDVGGHVNCSSWSPDTITVEPGQQFLQHRQCDQVQNRTITQRSYDASTQTYSDLPSITETRTQLVDESQAAVGNKVASAQSSSPSSSSSSNSPASSAATSSIASTWIPAANLAGDWGNDGEVTGCSSWSPNANTVGLGVSFAQTRMCTQPQVRTITRREYNTSTGEYRVLDSTQQTSSASVTETKTAIGELEQWVATESSYTAWASTGESQSTSWTPGYAGKRADWTQSKTTTYSQERYEQKREIETNTASLRNIEDPIRQTRTGNSISTTRLVTASVGATATTLGVFTQWTPTSGGQTTTYSQSRSANQESDRTWTYTTENTVIGSEIEVIPVTTVNEARSVDVVYSAWVNNGATTGCTTWSPDALTIATGQAFTQTRTCSQPQSRAITHSVSGTEVYGTTESNSITVTETQQGVGNNGEWAVTTPSYGSWVNSGVAYNYGTWVPAYGAQVSWFQQSRTYLTPQTRTVQQREYNATTMKYRLVGDITNETRNYSQNENRTVLVSGVAREVFSGERNFTIDPLTYNMYHGNTSDVYAISFTAEKQYFTDFTFKLQDDPSTVVHSWTRNDGSTGAESYNGSMNVVAPSTWSTSGAAYACSAWSPASNTKTIGATFTQSRSCTQDYTRVQTQTLAPGGLVITNNGTKSGSVTQQQAGVGTAPVSGCYYWKSSGRQDADVTANTFYQSGNGNLIWNGLTISGANMGIAKPVGTVSATVNDGLGPVNYTVSAMQTSGFYEICKNRL